MGNEDVIRKFYDSFAAQNVEAMVACYHDDIEFSDPVFVNLKGEDAKNMWRMLIARGGGAIEINYSNVRADDKKGAADWTANYVFSQTGRKVFNRISAEFEFRDGKIIHHTDTFDFPQWSRQALGTIGLLFGGTSFLQNKIRRRALNSLHDFSAKK